MTGLVAGTAAIENFLGTALHPGEPAYDQARAVFNGMIDRRPSSCGVARRVTWQRPCAMPLMPGCP